VRRWLVAAVLLAVVGGGVALVRGDVPCEVLTLQPSCDVALRPGPAEDSLALVAVTGAPTFDSAGELRLTTVAVDDDLGLQEWLRARTSDTVEAVPRATVFPPGADREEVAEQNAALMADSQLTATIVALEAVGYELDERGARVAAIASDAVTDELTEGDVIVAVDDDRVADSAAVVAAVQARDPGERLTFEVVAPDGERTRGCGRPRRRPRRPVAGLRRGAADHRPRPAGRRADRRRGDRWPVGRADVRAVDRRPAR
jgi:Lon-like protease